MADWGFLTDHARVLLYIAPRVRLRDIAASTGITETHRLRHRQQLTAADRIVKHKDGRRNRYQILLGSNTRSGR
jgi:hypothetical protein